MIPTKSPSTSSSQIVGFDVSHYQEEVDFLRAKNAGTEFVFIKATEGMDITDKWYAQHISQARKAGLVTGSYHLYRTNYRAMEQFELFSSHVSISPGDLPPAIDIETWTLEQQYNPLDELKQFISSIKARYGVDPIIYANWSVATSYLSSLGRYPLWIAEYADAAAPKLPNGWNEWTFWQYSNSGKIDGISNDVDLDCFNGDTQSFSSLLIKQLQE